MKYPVVLVVIIVLSAVLSACTHKLVMQLTSPVFQNNEYLSDKYTCDGQNVNPPIFISDTPPETKSFALLVGLEYKAGYARNTGKFCPQRCV